MPQFDVSSFSSQLFWLITVVSLLYIIVSKFVVPKIEILMSRRSSIIEDNISLAQKYNDQIKAIELYKADMEHEIASTIEDISSQQQNIFEAEWAKKHDSINKKIKQLQLDSHNDIQKFIELFLREEPRYCCDLSQMIIKKITDKDADITLLEKLYDRYYQ
ncbi:MAG: hypothetical protein H6909_00225 [Rickettsiaceae bacterium]|nr:hypothetical protein [Rickettsiaceae bacterium]